MKTLQNYIIESLSRQDEQKILDARDAYYNSFKKQLKGNKHVEYVDEDDVYGLDIIDGTSNSNLPAVSVTFKIRNGKVEVYHFVNLAGESHFEYDPKTVDKDALTILKFVHLDK